MAEHARTTDEEGNVRQFVDTQLYMVIDTYTGEPERFGASCSATGTFEEALGYLTRNYNRTTRLAVVAISAVMGFTVRRDAKHE